MSPSNAGSWTVAEPHSRMRGPRVSGVSRRELLLPSYCDLWSRRIRQCHLSQWKWPELHSEHHSRHHSERHSGHHLPPYCYSDYFLLQWRRQSQHHCSSDKHQEQDHYFDEYGQPVHEHQPFQERCTPSSRRGFGFDVGCSFLGGLLGESSYLFTPVRS